MLLWSERRANPLSVGRDTTAQALSWWFWYLITRPDIVEAIRAETEKVIGKDGAVDYENLKASFHSASLAVQLTQVSSQEFTFTTACFYETVRLPAPAKTYAR